MKLTGTEIRSQEFPQKMRGYSKLDVDAFLQSVGDAMDTLLRRNDELRERMEELEAEVRRVHNREALLEQSLQSVNELRGEMKNRTDALLQAAQSEARAKLRQAEEEAKRIKEEAEWSVRRVREESESLRNTRHRALEDFADFLRSQHMLLENEAERLGIDLPSLTGMQEDKVVSLKKQAKGEDT